MSTWTQHRNLLLLVLLTALTLAVFSPAVLFDYVKLDDDQYVANNRHIATGLSWDNIRWAFVTPHENWWLPLLWISYMADAELFGHRPFGYHLTNILLHAANVALLFWVLFRLTGSRWRSAFVAALFALHPLRVEAVVWITSRKDVLSGLFFMLSLLAYLRYVEQSTRQRYAALFGLMLAGLMSKAILIILPVLLLLLDYWPLRRVSPATWPRLLFEKVPLFILAAGFTLIGLRTHMTDAAVGADLSVLARFGLMFPNFWEYLRLTFWPADLALIYPERDIIHWPTSLAALVGLLIISGFCFALRARAPYLMVGWLWFLIGLLPIIRGVRFGLAAYADRYTYLPLIGLGIMLAWGAVDATRRIKNAGLALAIAAALLVLACTWRTAQQIPLWRDSYTMFSRLIEQAPNHYTANNNYGKALMDVGRLEDALPYFQRAAGIRPWSSLAIANLGEALLDLGRDAEAAQQMEQAMRERDPDHVNVRFILGRAYLNLNRPADAIPHIDFAYRAHPYRVGWLIELVRAYYESGRTAEAEQAIRVLQSMGVGYIRSYESLFPYYAHVWRQGESGHAWPFFRNAVDRHPDQPDILARTAWLIATDPSPPVDPLDALDYARRAVALTPAADAGVLDVLAAAHAANGQFEQAVQVATRALNTAQAAGQTDLALRIAQRLSSYRDNRPWRE